MYFLEDLKQMKDVFIIWRVHGLPSVIQGNQSALNLVIFTAQNYGTCMTL